MERLGTVHSAVHKASRVSKRAGKWSNLQEIKRKISNPTTFKQPVRPLLNKLVKNSDIEKKAKFSLWRPDDSGALGKGGGSSAKRGRGIDRGKERGERNGGKRPDGRRTSERKTGQRTSDRRTTKGGRRTVARTVAAGAVGAAVRGSINSTIRRVMF